jgi:hypothetical protein
LFLRRVEAQIVEAPGFICGHTEDGNTETENLTNTFILKTIIMEHKISVVIITLNEERILKSVCRGFLLLMK